MIKVGLLGKCVLPLVLKNVKISHLFNTYFLGSFRQLLTGIWQTLHSSGQAPSLMPYLGQRKCHINH